MKNYVIIPTYSEAENLRELLKLLKKFNVIIVDDYSGDGTKEVCDRFVNVRLMTRKNERGLASAVMDGILSIKDRNAKVVVMDADFQHDPKKLPEFFKKLDEFDFICGYREKSKMSGYRKLMSKTAKMLARILIPETKVIDDPMSGYFGFKLNSVNLSKVEPEGYKIMLDILTNLKPNARIGSVRYEFNRRKFGDSKLGSRVILNFLHQSIRLNHHRLITFMLVGISGVFVNEAVAFILHGHTQLYIVFVLSAETSIITNFILNHVFTFKRRTKFTKSFPRYNLIALTGLVINVLVAVYLSFFIYYLVANLVGILTAFVFNYSLSEVFAWNKD
jgi:dolichol-phosphate mannosyltransferase